MQEQGEGSPRRLLQQPEQLSELGDGLWESRDELESSEERGGAVLGELRAPQRGGRGPGSGPGTPQETRSGGEGPASGAPGA